MDLVVLRIFRWLGFLPYGEGSTDVSRLNPWVIGRKIGVGGATVKARLRRLRESGFIGHFQVYPNFRILGIQGAAYVFDVGDVRRKHDVIEHCALVDGVTEIHEFLGTRVCIDLTFSGPRDEQRRLGLLQRLTGCPNPLKFYERAMPPVDVTLTRADWRIIQALRYRALRPLSEVADTLGLSTKTVRRRYDRMARHNALIIVPAVNPARLPSTISHLIVVHPEPSRWNDVVGEILRTFDASWFLTRFNPPHSATFYLTASTLDATEANLVRIQSFDGVQQAQLAVLKEVRECSGWLDAAIEQRISEAAPSPVQTTGRLVPSGALDPAA